MMALWCMMRSPLMMGGELNRNDTFTLSLLTNAALLEIEKASFCAHPLFTTEEESAWIAPRVDGKGGYAAVFNLSDAPRRVANDRESLEAPWTKAVELWTNAPAVALCADLEPHDCAVWRFE